MNFKLNRFSHLKLDEIIKKLFNCQSLSDIQFSVDGQIIYAHSLMLQMRSEVFEMQLEATFGEQKLIPITDCSYDNFLEFIRFIYTDECEINDNNGIELLKLATKYKLTILENRVINALTSLEWIKQLYVHCVNEKFDIARNRAEYEFCFHVSSFVNTNEFLTFHPDAVNAILHLETIYDITEYQIFSALSNWIKNYCELNEMSLAQGRQKFQHFIRLIRFPAMSTDEIRACAKNNPELLNDSDCMTIAQQVLFGNNTGWISTRREAYIYKYKCKNFNRATLYETKFSVLKDTILNGFWIGTARNEKKIEIVITEKNQETNESEKIQFTQCDPAKWYGLLISLGDAIRVKPNFEYTIGIKYLDVGAEQPFVVCRASNVPLIYNNPENSIKTITASDNMMEMIFKSAP